MFNNFDLSKSQRWVVRSCTAIFTLSLLFPPTHYTRSFAWRGAGWAGFQFVFAISPNTDISPSIWVVEWVGLAILLIAGLFLARGASSLANESNFHLTTSSFETKPTATAGALAKQEVIARTKGPPTVRSCKLCGRPRLTQYVHLRSNVSYLFQRRESHLSGFLCFSCLNRSFALYEVKTLLFTWWGLIGIALGPLFLLDNLVQYARRSVLFLRARLVKANANRRQV